MTQVANKPESVPKVATKSAATSAKANVSNSSVATQKPDAKRPGNSTLVGLDFINSKKKAVTSI